MHPTRHGIRHVGAFAALLMAGIYFLIGLGVVGVGGAAPSAEVDLFAFGIGAGTAFLVMTAVFEFTDRLWIWALALVIQLLIFAMYVAVSGVRVPPFEIWGLTLRTIQLVVIACIAYQLATIPERRKEVRP